MFDDAKADLARGDRTSAAGFCGSWPEAAVVRRTMLQRMNQRWVGVTFLAAALRIERSTQRALG